MEVGRYWRESLRYKTEGAHHLDVRPLLSLTTNLETIATLAKGAK